MLTIYKYPLEVTNYQAVNLPKKHQILSVQNQEGRLCLWALVDTDSPGCDVEIYICGTGNPITEPMAELTFVGTVQQGPFVWHVFYED